MPATIFLRVYKHILDARRLRYVSNDYMNNQEGSEDEDIIIKEKSEFQPRDQRNEEMDRDPGSNLGIRRFSPDQNLEGSGNTLQKIVFDPDGDISYYWMGVVTMAVLYNVAVIILRLTFSEMREMPGYLFYIFDLMFDSIYLLDIAMQFRVAYYDDGCLVLDPKKLGLHYRSEKRFKLDLLSVLPIQYIGIFFNGLLKFVFLDMSYLHNIYIPLARVPRLFKVHTVIRFFQTTDSRTSNPNTVRAFKLSLYLWLVIHWIGCIYYMLSEYEGRGSNEWVYPDGAEYDCFSRKYIRCLYWSMLILTTIGERPSPQTDLEYVFTGMTFIIGVFVFAAVVGNVGDVISNMNASRQDFQARMDQIKFYMHHRNVPEGLQNRVKQWAEYTWTRTQAMDEPHVLQMLPDRLRTEIAIQVHLDTLKKVTIFKECEEGLLRELVLKLKPQIYSPGDYICHIGEVGREMFIINHGKVEIVVPGQEHGKGTVVATLTSGNFFGEISLLKLDDGQNRRTADVRAIGYSELLCLSRKDLMTALVEYPDAKKILETQARERMRKMKEMRNSSADDASSTRDGQTKQKKDWFIDVIKSDGFQKLLSNRGSEISELRKIIDDLKRYTGQLHETTMVQPKSRCRVLETRLQQAEKELQQARSRIAELELSLKKYENEGPNSRKTANIRTKQIELNGTKHETLNKSWSITTTSTQPTKQKVEETQKLKYSGKYSSVGSLESKVTRQKFQSRNVDRHIPSNRTLKPQTQNVVNNVGNIKQMRSSSNDTTNCTSYLSRSMHSIPQRDEQTDSCNRRDSIQHATTSSGYSSDTETLNTLLHVSSVLHQQAKEALCSSSDESTDYDDSSILSDDKDETNEDKWEKLRSIWLNSRASDEVDKNTSCWSHKTGKSCSVKETDV